jgi:hypothetical protein
MECGGKRSATPLWNQRAGLFQQKAPSPLRIINRTAQDNLKNCCVSGSWLG